MMRLVPYPFLAISLFIVWLLLNQSLAPGHLALGVVAAVSGTWLMTMLSPEPPRFRMARKAIRLAGLVVVDIFRSNLAVGSIVLGARRDRVSNFVSLPLDLRNRYGLAVLALIITATPGTIWVEFDRTRSVLLVHVLDLVDEDAWVRLIKGRYERLLLEIFE